MITDKFDIDERDIKIISYYMENPDISQSEVADKLGLSQPSVFVRIQKLKKKGLLNYQVGLNFNKAKIFLIRVDLTSKNPNELLEEMARCPYFVNGFIISGEHNVSLILANDNLKNIDKIVNTHLRSKDTVSNINMNVIVSSAKDYIFRIDLDKHNTSDCCVGCEN